MQFIESYIQEQGSVSRGAGDGTTKLGEPERSSTSGDFMGRHNGLHNYTVGQRRGLGFAVGRFVFVVASDRTDNRLIVGEDGDLRQSICEVRDVN